MPTPLNQRMRTAGALTPALQALLGLSPFRWWFDQLRQGSLYPAIVQTQISSNKTYTATQRLATGWSRQQFLIWGGYDSAGEQARQDVSAAFYTFLDGFSGGTGVTGLQLYPNEVVMERDFSFVQGKSLIYQRIVDVMVFSDDRL
jgi:hypothetical protein